MTFHRVVAAALIGIGFSAVLIPASEVGASPTTLTVGSAQRCTGTYTTISDAVAAAAPGDTIQVCAGTYDETVDVNIPDLTFDGARAGHHATAARAAALTKESVVSDVNGDFILGPGADNTTIDGFALEGAGSPSVNHDGIEAFAGSSGLNVTDNVIDGNGNGINLQNPDASDPAVITRNYIVNNNSEGNLGANGETGTGVFISNGPADNTSITYNTFGQDSQTAINFAGDTGNPSVGLIVTKNTSLNDSTFVVAINSVNADIEGNKITVNGTVPGGNGTGILDFGGNSDLRIMKNKMTSNSTVSGAISLATYAGSASAGTTVSGNTVSGWDYGVYVASSYDSALVASNHISKNGIFGIYVNSSTNGNVLSRNRVLSDNGGSVDCTDLSTGVLTDGTANTWLKNVGTDGNSTPSGIC
ncbi:MAG TPA: right-handed parallel beta-helix repeat-containing protein [Acidimicrobiales bacterium]|nr:right-handed parallel beta-helix repeat-containing protein [Acidimicrobiales bacterium]